MFRLKANIDQPPVSSYPIISIFLFTDTPFDWNRDRLLIEQYAEGIQYVVQKTLSGEEAILVAVYPVYHIA